MIKLYNAMVLRIPDRWVFCLLPNVYSLDRRWYGCHPTICHVIRHLVFKAMKGLGSVFYASALCCTEVGRWSFIEKWLCIYMVSSVIRHFISCHMMKVMGTVKDECSYTFTTQSAQNCTAFLTNCQVRKQITYITYKIPN